MPVGYLITVAVAAAGMGLAVRPLGRSGWRGTVSWLMSCVPAESPFVVFYWTSSGRNWRGTIDPTYRKEPDGLAWARILLTPLPLFPRGVRRLRNIAYGDAGRHNDSIPTSLAPVLRPGRS